MKKIKRLIDPDMERKLVAMGDRLRLARRRRKLSVTKVCGQAGFSRMTLYRIESGDPTVAIGSYANVLQILQLDGDLDALALDDVIGRQLQDMQIAGRRSPAGKIKGAL